MIENREIPLADIHPPKLQPRLAEEDDDLDELVASIAAHGLISPLAVTPTDEGYQLLAGNRRYHALQRLGWTTAPCRVIHASPELADEITIAENLIRRNLSPLEEAYAFAMYLGRTESSQEALAERMGKERTYVTRRLLLLDLDDLTLGALEDGIINLSQALILRQVEDPAMRERLVEHAQTYGANVRTMQYWVSSYNKEQTAAARAQEQGVEPAAYQPPREVYMACDRCGNPTSYATLRPVYLCPNCHHALAAYRAAKEGEQ